MEREISKLSPEFNLGLGNWLGTGALKAIGATNPYTWAISGVAGGAGIIGRTFEAHYQPYIDAIDNRLNELSAIKYGKCP